MSSPEQFAGSSSTQWPVLLQTPAPERASVHIHLVGIGGAGLSAIATLLVEWGFTVSGSDQRPNPATIELERLGVQVYRGHKATHVAGADLVLRSSAVPDNNPEVAAALASSIPVIKRRELFGPLMHGLHGIGIAGAHGKTTTTSMIAVILLRAGLDPSIIVGGQMSVGPAEGMPCAMSMSAHAGQGPFVIEADEYDGMFLGLDLEIAVVTNVEWDHVDCYPTPQLFAEAFRQFVSQLPVGGYLLLCADDPGALALRDSAPAGVTVQTYGFSAGADWQIVGASTNAQRGLDAEVWFGGRQITNLSLAIPGSHNLRNALAALAAAHHHGIDPHWAAIMLQDFRGAGRRFELIGEADGVSVIDDYGHHPTEIAATLSAARLRYPTRRIWAVFQPHTFSRTKALADLFAHSFDDADFVLLLDIFPAREKIDLGMHSRDLLTKINHANVHYGGSIADTVTQLLAQVQPEDVVITLSAGDGNQVGQQLLRELHAKEEAV